VRSLSNTVGIVQVACGPAVATTALLGEPLTAEDSLKSDSDICQKEYW